MSTQTEYNEQKLRELILYVAERSLGDVRFGKTKLNKILFFADFEAYRDRGEPITGAVYQHLQYGPAPHQMMPVLLDMHQSNEIEYLSERTFAGQQHRVLPLRQAKTDLFSGREIAIVNEVLDRLAQLTNQQVSDLSHETMAWRLTREGEEIPYGTAVFSAEPLTDDDVAWAAEVAANHGLLAGA